MSFPVVGTGKTLRLIVGSECGMFGEGNLQWYYTLALAISVMLAWKNLTQQEAIVFTAISLVHIALVHIYALCGWEDSKGTSILYVLLNVSVLVIAFFTNWKFALLSIGIMGAFLLVSPDGVGESILLTLFLILTRLRMKENHSVALLTHTIVFAVFVITVCTLPVIWWVKVLIVCLALVLHPLIDYLSGECVDVAMIAVESVQNILFY